MFEQAYCLLRKKNKRWRFPHRLSWDNRGRRFANTDTKISHQETNAISHFSPTLVRVSHKQPFVKSFTCLFMIYVTPADTYRQEAFHWWPPDILFMFLCSLHFCFWYRGRTVLTECNVIWNLPVPGCEHPSLCYAVWETEVWTTHLYRGWGLWTGAPSFQLTAHFHLTTHSQVGTAGNMFFLYQGIALFMTVKENRRKDNFCEEKRQKNCSGSSTQRSCMLKIFWKRNCQLQKIGLRMHCVFCFVRNASEFNSRSKSIYIYLGHETENKRQSGSELAFKLYIWEQLSVIPVDGRSASVLHIEDQHVACMKIHFRPELLGWKPDLKSGMICVSLSGRWSGQ